MGLTMLIRHRSSIQGNPERAAARRAARPRVRASVRYPLSDMCQSVVTMS
jgi:hypothetical protein